MIRVHSAFVSLLRCDKPWFQSSLRFRLHPSSRCVAETSPILARQADATSKFFATFALFCGSKIRVHLRAFRLRFYYYGATSRGKNTSGSI
jgi:hypothetical protein